MSSYISINAMSYSNMNRSEVGGGGEGGLVIKTKKKEK